LPNLSIEPISFFESGNVVLVHALMTAENFRAETMHMFTINDRCQIYQLSLSVFSNQEM